MTTKQIALIEDTWDFVITNTDEAGSIFYGRLFEESPDLRALFKQDMRDQERKLIALITFAVGKLGSLDEIIEDVRALGTRHKVYGVKPEHYENVASALLWTLETALAERWNEEVRDAWTTLYMQLATIMQAAPQQKARVL